MTLVAGVSALKLQFDPWDHPIDVDGDIVLSPHGEAVPVGEMGLSGDLLGGQGAPSLLGDVLRRKVGVGADSQFR